MKDLGGVARTPRRWLPLVIGLHVGLFGLAMHLARSPQGPNPPPTLPEDGPAEPGGRSAPGVDRAVVLGQTESEGQTPAASATTPAEPRRLPPLSGPTRALVASFRPLAEELEIVAPKRSPVGAPADEPFARLGPLLGLDGHDETRAVPRVGEEGPCESSPVRLEAPVAVQRVESGALPPEEIVGEAEPWPGPAAEDDFEPPEAISPRDSAAQTAPPFDAIGNDVAEGDARAREPAEDERWWGESEPLAALAPGPSRRSLQLEMIARQADAHTRQGFELAGRRAFFSARSEFIMALRLVAQGLDNEHNTGRHSEALARGLAAIKEAEEFIPSGSRLEADLDLRAIVAGHRTPVLKDARLDGLTPLGAVERYFTYAQEQLAAAAGSEVAGSMALHGLGKLHAALAEQAAMGVRAADSKAVVYYQAALLVDPRNFMVANDLGVLLARSGYYREASATLIHSLAVQPRAEGWRNLAVVYRQLGQHEQALRAAQQWQAMRQAEIARRGQPPESRAMVRWVPPETFARANPDVPAADPAPRAVPRRDEPTPRQAAGRGWHSNPSAPADVKSR